jgi:hypothetical protein
MKIKKPFLPMVFSAISERDLPFSRIDAEGR